MQVTHSKPKGLTGICPCGAEVLKDSDVAEKTSDVTCLECLNLLHSEFRFEGRWKLSNYCLKVFKKRKQIGEGTLSRSKMMTPHIHDLWVEKEFRYRGIGARIVRILLTKATPPITLKAEPYYLEGEHERMSQNALFRFYERCGFQKTGRGNYMVYCPMICNDKCVIQMDENKDNFYSCKVSVKGFPELTGLGRDFRDAVANLISSHGSAIGIKFDPVTKSKNKQGVVQ